MMGGVDDFAMELTMKTTRALIQATLSLSLLAMTACTTTNTNTPDSSRAASMAEAGELVAPGIYDVATGQLVTRAQLFGELSRARFVVVGESHDDPFHHEVELSVYRGVATSRDAGAVLLGMEMFQRPFQGPLDEYVAKNIDQDTMLAQTEWEKRWKFPVEFYAPLWKFARENGWKVVALNAPRELTRRLSKVGVDGLNDAERAQLPELDLQNAAHKNWVKEVFASHGMSTDDDTFENFYAAQVLWDETMAQAAVEAMDGRSGDDAMVIVAGSGHVMNRWGIPSRIERRLGDAAGQVKTVIVVSSPEAANSLQARTSVTRADLGMWRSQGYADYVWIQ